MYHRILQRQIVNYSKKIIAPYFRQLDKLTISKSNLISHTSCRFKVVISNENVFAYDVISKFSPEKSPVLSEKISTVEDFNNFLDHNWRLSTATEIVNAFKNVKEFSVENGITLSDSRFNKLVDGLMDQCENLTLEELMKLLYCITEFPSCDSYTSHNFHDIWSCLDDVCCFKMIEWNVDTSFEIANIWFKLNLGRLCDYIYVLIDRYVRKADYLSKDQLANIYFYFNVCRKRAVDFEYEHALEKLVKYMTADEMGVVAMGYFKTKTKIKIVPIMEAMVQKVIEDSTNINEISLAAILKILRFSKPYQLIPQINVMLDKIYNEIPRLSDVCCIHIALLGTGIQTYHPKTIQQICHRLIKKIHDVNSIRLKDIERILNALTMYNYDPKTDPDIFTTCFEEIHKQQRIEEETKYTRALICTLNFLSLRNLYSYQLMDKVLDIDYIKDTFGKTPKTLPRELFSLDCCIEAECPNYKGNRLTPEFRYKAAKWLTEYNPSYDQHKKITAADKLILDTVETVQEIVKDKNYMYIQHVLPHFPKADIILCKDKNADKFVQPLGFQKYIYGDIMFPFNSENLDWFAIVIVGWNNTVRDTSFPLGHMIMKKRQLTKVGYHPIFVIWNEFLPLNSSGRTFYILNKLNNYCT